MPEAQSQPHARSAGLQSESRPKAACWVVLCVVGIAILAACRPAPRMAMASYFPQTGHTVQGPFYAYFQAHGGTQSFGHPITEEVLRDGLVVQYFEKVRMEYHPDNPPRYRVQLGLLGKTLGRREPPIPSPDAPPAFDCSRRYYPRTGHSVPQPFLACYDAHGGLDRFGYPLSEPYSLDGALAQDFQRARLMLRHGEIEIADWGRTFLARQSSVRAPQP